MKRSTKHDDDGRSLARPTAAVVVARAIASASSQQDLSSDFRSPPIQMVSRSQKEKICRNVRPNVKSKLKSSGASDASTSTPDAAPPSASNVEPINDKLNDDKNNVDVISPSDSGSATTSSQLVEPVAAETRRCPSCCRLISTAVYPSHVIRCLRKFSRDVNAAETQADGATVIKLQAMSSAVDVDLQHECVVCGRNISHLNERRREQHMNRCLDSAKHEERAGTASSNGSQESSLAEVVLPCPFCHFQPKTQTRRMPHIKKCATKAGVPPNKVLEAIQLLERQARECLEAGLPMLLVPVVREVHKKKSVSRKQNGQDTNSEEMNIAMALSLSETDIQQRAATALINENDLPGSVQDGHQHSATVSKMAKAKGKNSKTKQKEATPLLLVRSADDRAAIIADRIAKIVTENKRQEQTVPAPRFLIDWSRAPPHTSRFKQQTASASECSLWKLASLSADLTSDPAVFYVQSLRPFITPCKVKPGDKLKRLSQVPGYLTQRPQPTELDAGPSTQEIAQLMGDVDDCSDANVHQGQSGYISLANDQNNELDDVDTADCVQNNSDNNDGHVVDDYSYNGIIDEMTDSSDTERRVLGGEKMAAARRDKTRAIGEIPDQRLKDMQDDFSQATKKRTSTDIATLTSSACTEKEKRGREEENEQGHDDQRSTCESPDLFGDIEDEILDKLDLETPSTSKGTAAATPEINSPKASAAEAPDCSDDDKFDDVMQISASAALELISTSTPKQTPDHVSVSRKRRFSISPLIESDDPQACPAYDMGKYKKRKSVSFRQETDTIGLESTLEDSVDKLDGNAAKQSVDNEQQSPKVKSEDSQQLLQSLVKETPPPDKLVANSECSNYNNSSSRMFMDFDVWDNFQDDGGYCDQPVTSFCSKINTSQIKQCEGKKPTTTMAYSPRVSSSSENSQDYFPDIDTPFKKDASIIVYESGHKKIKKEIEKEVEKPKKPSKKKEEKAAGKQKQKEKAVTPLPHYSIMPTPEIRKELAKIGVKALPKKKGAKFLNYVYEQMHPCKDANEDNDDGSADRNAQASQEPTPKRKKKTHKKVAFWKDDEHNDVEEEDVGEERVATSPIRKSKRPTKMSKKSKLTTQESGDGSCSENVQKNIYDFITSHLDWHEEILQYKVIDVNALHEDLKSAGMKISKHSLKNYLDEQCVTYSDSQHSQGK